MTVEFLLFANLVLFLRLRLLLVNPAAGPGGWLRKGLIEILAAALFGWTRITVAIAIITVVMNVAGAIASRRRTRCEEWQFIIGMAHLLALSVALSAKAGPSFCSDAAAVAVRLHDWTALQGLFHRLFAPSVQLVLFGLLVSANEANLLLRAVFERLDLRPRRAKSGGEIDSGEYNRGRVIGLLERALIYCFVLNGQFGVIGFTLAAKAFTRFKELDDRAFAEYVLIGTLLSSVLAVATALLVRALA